MFHHAGKRHSKKRALFIWLIPALVLSLFVLVSGCSRGEPVVLPSESAKGMSLESLYVKGSVSILTVTGGVFRVDSETGTVEIRQRIGKERPLAEVTLAGGELKGMAAPTQMADSVLWGGSSPESPKMIISRDSVIHFQNIKNMTVKFLFSPMYHKFKDTNGGLLALDDTGGLAIIPPETNLSDSWRRTFDDNFWQLRGDEPLPFLFIGVCPPRQFDWERSLMPVVHYSSHIQRYPTDEQIIGYSQYARVLEMHSWVWQNRYDPNDQIELEPYMEGKAPLWMDKSYLAQDYKWIPDDEAELKRVISTCHKYGMKFVPYVNMISGDLETQMAEMKWLKDTYGIDGVYMDGLYNDKPELAYEAARALRELFGEDGWLTLHNTRWSGYFFPFVNTYFDLIVTGEHQPFDRWTSTEYNISNAIASLWPEIPLSVKDGREFLKKLVDESLRYNNRVMFMTGEQGQWRQWRLYFTEDEMSFMQEYYLGALKRLSATIPGAQKSG
jgi:hypothetical protein